MEGAPRAIWGSWKSKKQNRRSNAKCLKEAWSVLSILYSKSLCVISDLYTQAFECLISTLKESDLHCDKWRKHKTVFKSFVETHPTFPSMDHTIVFHQAHEAPPWFKPTWIKAPKLCLNKSVKQFLPGFKVFCRSAVFLGSVLWSEVTQEWGFLLEGHTSGSHR